jgi:hypothetical protein
MLTGFTVTNPTDNLNSIINVVVAVRIFVPYGISDVLRALNAEIKGSKQARGLVI